MESKVFFTDMRVADGDNLLAKLNRLITSAGIDQIDFNKKFVALKIHFGEPGNMAHIRPQYARVVVDKILSKGGRPYLTDCNTLYVGRRGNGYDHLQAAYENGWVYGTTHAHVVIADGVKGNDEEVIPINESLVKEAKIGKAIADADVVITLNHFKGHELAGFGGAIKNLGMGSASRRGKMEQHCDGKLSVNSKQCRCCRKCATRCAQDAISFDTGKAVIDPKKCVGCGRCLTACNFNAIYNGTHNAAEQFNVKMAEYTKAVLQGKPSFHINLVMDISPVCDCYSGNDTAIIPNVGFFASFDPVALDRACVDACNAQPMLPNTRLVEALPTHEDTHDHFCNTNIDSNYSVALAHSEEIGIGTQKYQLIKVK